MRKSRDAFINFEGYPFLSVDSRLEAVVAHGMFAAKSVGRKAANGQSRAPRVLRCQRLLCKWSNLASGNRFWIRNLGIEVD